MGFSIRKRTKGKGSWLNYSYSKRGFHASHTVKMGDLTLNFGKKVRTTVNMGDGMRYVKTRNADKPTKSRPAKQSRNYTNVKSVVRKYTTLTKPLAPEKTFSSENVAMMSGFFWMTVGLVVCYLISSILFTIAFIHIAHATYLNYRKTDYPQDTLAYFVPSIILITPVGWIYILILFLLV